MQPEAFYEQALDLLRQGGSANIRTAASRAYYSTFHVARKKTEDVEILVEVRGSHRLVQEKVKLSYGEQLADYLKKMSRKRNNADYDLDEPFSTAQVEQIIEMRSIFLESFASTQKRQVQVVLSDLRNN